MSVGDRTVGMELVRALSELATSVQRGRTVEDVLRIAGEGCARLGIRLLVFQIDGDDLVLRSLSTSPERYDAVERLIETRIIGLRAPLDRCEPAAEIVTRRTSVHRPDLDLFVRFIIAATGRDPLPLDASPATSGISNGVVTPLFVHEEPWGLLLMLSPSLRSEDAAAVALFATHVGAALEVAEFVRTLQQTQEELIARERLATIGELAAAVAHEIRNPLGVLFNSVATLRHLVQGTLGRSRRSDAEVLLSIVSEETENLNEIVTDLLELARPWAMRTKETSLASVVRDVAKAVPRLPEGSAVDVQIELCAEMPPVEIDARMVRQALLNLVVNALQAMPAGGTLEIATRIEHRDDDRSFACIDVTDTGAGIRLEDHARVLEPFYTTKPAATGLGLPLVKRVVEAHEGELGFASDEAGTTFTIRLPLPTWDDSRVRLKRVELADRPSRATGTGR